jgi:hypothetical protein
MPAPTPQTLTPALPTVLTEREPQPVRNEARLSAIVQTAYILEATRR